jgi:serine/threonine protein kinase
MEYIPGATVAKTIAAEGAIPEKQALKIILQVAEALEEAWEKGSLIHRNISPRNIMQDVDGTVKISDLGMAKLADFSTATSQAGNVQIRGLYNYKSPEQAAHSTQLDCRTDMYSVGATLYHIGRGVPTLPGRSA